MITGWLPGITAVLVDRTEHRFRVIVVDEGAGTVIDGLARNRWLSVFITPWTKPILTHLATSDACASPTRRKNSRYRSSRPTMFWKVAGDGIIGQLAKLFGLAARCKNWKVPTRRCEAAMRCQNSAFPAHCARFLLPVVTAAKARVVGTPRACIACPSGIRAQDGAKNGPCRLRRVKRRAA